MADVLLGQAYYLRFDPKLWQAQQPYAPLGTLYAASYLRAARLQRRAVRRDAGRVRGGVGRRARPRIVRASRSIYEDSFNYLSKMCLLRMREAALDDDRRMRARARRARSSSSGSDATDHPELYLRRGADAVILGEGEVTLADLLDRAARRTASIERRARHRATCDDGVRRAAHAARVRSSRRSTRCRSRPGISSTSSAIARSGTRRTATTR